MKLQKNLSCKDCAILIWNVSTTGLCKPCWGLRRKGVWKHSDATKKKLSGFRVDNPGYATVHNRVRKLYGKPSLCEHCGTTTAKKFHWANRGKLEIERSNWYRLCVSCHHKFDNKILNTTKGL